MARDTSCKGTPHPHPKKQRWIVLCCPFKTNQQQFPSKENTKEMCVFPVGFSLKPTKTGLSPHKKDEAKKHHLTGFGPAFWAPPCDDGCRTPGRYPRSSDRIAFQISSSASPSLFEPPKWRGFPLGFLHLKTDLKRWSLGFYFNTDLV